MIVHRRRFRQNLRPEDWLPFQLMSWNLSLIEFDILSAIFNLVLILCQIYFLVIIIFSQPCPVFV